MTRRMVAAVALALLAAGCGQHQTQRAALASYLKQVNKIEAALVGPLGTVTATGNQFAREQSAGGTLTNLLTASHEQALLRAWSRIESLRGRLAAIPAPQRAVRLRGLLLQIVDGQARLTREVAQLVAFLPGFNAALQPLVPATRRLESALAHQTPAASVAIAYASKAAALRGFRASVDSVLNRLRPLQPPSLSRPEYETEVASLQGMSSSAGQLAKALTDGPQNNIPQLLLRFNRAATGNQTVAAQKAQIAAVRAYDAESAKLLQLSQAAEEERLRLANTLS